MSTQWNRCSHATKRNFTCKVENVTARMLEMLMLPFGMDLLKRQCLEGIIFLFY